MRCRVKEQVHITEARAFYKVQVAVGFKEWNYQRPNPLRHPHAGTTRQRGLVLKRASANEAPTASSQGVNCKARGRVTLTSYQACIRREGGEGAPRNRTAGDMMDGMRGHGL